MTVSSVGGKFERRDSGNSWFGNFAPNVQLLWDKGVGPDITLTFTNPVFGVGAEIQADFYGSFVAQVKVNGVQTFTELGNSDNAVGTAIFIGWAGGPISTFEFSLMSASSDVQDFAIGPVAIASAVPEPSTWAMMLIGFAGLGFLAQRKLKAKAVAA